MSNANRDYVIVYDVKNSSLALSRPLVFYITDKNTSNIFVRLVTRISIGNGIDQYTDIEEASNYVLTMRVIKPNNEVKSLEATQHEPESIFQFDLTEDFKDIPGKYICELTVSTTVNSRQELITSDPFGYEVKRSILSNVGEIVETEDTTVEKLLNELNATNARIDNLIAISGGSTTGNAELIDARFGADGITYDTLGQSIRTQINRVNGELFPTPFFRLLDLTFINGYYTLSGTINEASGNFRSEISVKAGETYKIKGASFWEMPMYAILKSDGTLKTTFPTTSTSEEYEKEVNIVEDGTLIVNYSQKRSGTGEEHKPIVYKKIYDSKIEDIENQIVNIDNLSKNNKNDISNIKGLITTEDYFNEVNLTFKNIATNINGGTMSSSGYYHCDIKINSLLKYKVAGYNYWQMPLYNILDSNGNILESYPQSSQEASFIEKEITSFPAGAATLRVNYTTNYAGTGNEFKSKCYTTKTIFDSIKNDISNIKNLLTEDDFNKVDLVFENTATSINGNTMSSSSYYHCDIEIDSISKYKVTGYNFWQMPLYLILDSNGNILDTYPKTAVEGAFIEKELSSFPVGAKTLRINYTTDYAGTGDELKSRCYEAKAIIDTKDTPLSNLGKTNSFSSIFEKYGIIGDSLSSGAQDLENGNNAKDMIQFSWATFLEKASGCETVRLAKGGLQLRNWHAIMESKARLEGNKCPAYIIMLGHNDAGSEVGSISDIDLNNLSNSNADTQFGMYGKLIGTLRDISPDCRIFCVTYPIYYVENYGTNSIPRTLPLYIDNCYCIDLWKYDKNRKVENNTAFATPNPHFAKLHGTVLGYKNWANIINSYIDYIIRNNMHDFADVAYINTGYTFN